jgi:hypothetical protein
VTDSLVEGTKAQDILQLRIFSKYTRRVSGLITFFRTNILNNTSNVTTETKHNKVMKTYLSTLMTLERL